MKSLKNELALRLKEYLETNNMTQKELADKLSQKGFNITPTAISLWLSGMREPRSEVRQVLYDILDISFNSNYGSIGLVKFPVLGRVACGEPIYSEIDKDCYVMADADIMNKYKPDFVVFCKGDSMQPIINDGDIVFVKKQPSVDRNGQIAVVLINDEATLKRVYIDNDKITLIAENKNYAPLFYTKEQCEVENVRICGIAVYNQTMLYNK